MKTKKSTNYIRILKIKILILSAAICLSSCTTPIPNEKETISYDGNVANSGVLGFMSDGSLEITPSAKEGYQSLCRKFGNDLNPPIGENYGLNTSEGHVSITLQAVEKWKKMMLMEERERIDHAK